MPWRMDKVLSLLPGSQGCRLRPLLPAGQGTWEAIALSASVMRTGRSLGGCEV